MDGSPNYCNADVKIFWREAGAKEYVHVKKDIHVECAVHSTLSAKIVAVRKTLGQV
jgi:hypothetical protein